jgi:hypothetical protein
MASQGEQRSLERSRIPLQVCSHQCGHPSVPIIRIGSQHQLCLLAGQVRVAQGGCTSGQLPGAQPGSNGQRAGATGSSEPVTFCSPASCAPA